MGRRRASASELGVPDPDPVRAMADGLVRDDSGARGGDKGECRQRRDCDRSRDEGEQDGSSNRRPPKNVANRPEEERHVRSMSRLLTHGESGLVHDRCYSHWRDRRVRRTAQPLLNGPLRVPTCRLQPPAFTQSQIECLIECPL